MKKKHKLRTQIFLYMTVGLIIWFAFGTALTEILYYLEDKRGVEFPFKFYIVINVFQAVLLLIVNIPFLRFLIRHIDNPVQKIVSALHQISEGNYNEQIDFNARNELDEIKEAFNEMSGKLAESEKIKKNAENERIMLFANMAHDLKTPITSIIGFSKALSDGIIEEEQKKKEYISTINSKSMKMNELIDRLFEYVKLQSSDNQLHLENVDVAEILRNCIADVYTEYEAKNIQLELEIPDAEVIKKADKLELSRVYTNLLNNVIKHNGSGIKVFVKMEGDGGTLIADSGEPLKPELVENLFKPFVSGDFSRRNSNGSGLGLSLAQKIMKKHGGNLRFVQENMAEKELPAGLTKGFVVEFQGKSE